MFAFRKFVYIDAGAYFNSDCHSNKSLFLVFIDSFIKCIFSMFKNHLGASTVYFCLSEPLNCLHHLDAYLCKA
jgi:hypothetical protein